MTPSVSKESRLAQDFPTTQPLDAGANGSQFAHECCGDQLKVPEFGQVTVLTSSRWLVSSLAGQRLQNETNYLCRSRRSSQ